MWLALAICPDRRARSMRFFTEEGDHFEPPRGVRSCSRSSWVAISRSVRFGFVEWIPATNVINRSSGRRGGEFAKQSRIGHPLRDHPFHGAAKTLRRPVEAALVQ